MTIRKSLLSLALVTASGIGPLAQAAEAPRDGTVFLLLHGLDSSVKKWNDVVRKTFQKDCITLNPGQDAPGVSRCYRYAFSSGQWSHGDGLTFAELGNEVKDAVAAIDRKVHPEAVVLVGHSRGGLAARAYLQSLDAPPAFSLGLLTIGTPHLGSPLGRAKPWMDARGFTPRDVKRPFRDQARFIFSPSTGYLATAHDSNGNLVCRPTDPASVSRAICRLTNRETLANLTRVTSVFGQITSRGLVLGEKAVAEDIDLLDGGIAKEALPGKFNQLRGYILENIARRNKSDFCSNSEKKDPNHWACNGDGVVPLISQDLQQLLKTYGVPTPVASAPLRKVRHTDLARQTRVIARTLSAMAQNDSAFEAP